MCSGVEVALLAGPRAGDVLGVDLGLPVVVVVLELEQLHGVDVEHHLQARDRVGVEVALGGLAVPDVAPAQPPVAPLLGHQCLAVGPHLDGHQRHVGDAAVGERRDHVGMGTHRLVDLVVLVHGEVRGHVGDVGPRQHGVVGQVDDTLEGLVVRPVPQHRERRTTDRVAGTPRLDLGLGRLEQLDGGEPPRLRQRLLAPESGNGLAELVRVEWFQRMRRHFRTMSDAGGGRYDERRAHTDRWLRSERQRASRNHPDRVVGESREFPVWTGETRPETVSGRCLD